MTWGGADKFSLPDDESEEISDERMAERRLTQERIGDWMISVIDG